MTPCSTGRVVLASWLPTSYPTSGAWDDCAFHLTTNIKNLSCSRHSLLSLHCINHTLTTVFDQTSVAARHILRPDPPLLSEHSSEHCHRASPLSPVRRPSYESLSIRSSRSSSTSTTSSSAFIIDTPITPTIPQPPNHPILHQSKNTDKDESTEGSDTNTMAPKTNYYPASHSSSDGDRVHYNPRREERETIHSIKHQEKASCDHIWWKDTRPCPPGRH